MALGGIGYQLLDAAQLIKHAFGLAHSRKNEPVTLVYLYWEPLDAGLSPFFAQHPRSRRSRDVWPVGIQHSKR